MRRNSLVQFGLLISNTPDLRWTTRFLALGHHFLVYSPLSFEISQNGAQHPPLQVASEMVVYLGSGHPIFDRVVEGFEDLVGYHVAGPVHADQVGRLLSVLPYG